MADSMHESDKSQYHNSQQQQAPMTAASRSEFQVMAKLIRDSFHYTVVSNEEAVYLLTLLDDIIYGCLENIDRVSDTVRTRYLDIVRHYAFHPVDGRSSYSSCCPDSIVLASLLWIPPHNWLEIIRHRVHLFRVYFMDMLHELDNGSEGYESALEVPETASTYLAAQERIQQVTDFLGAGDATYFVVREIRRAVARMAKIVRKLTYPYLRKVVVAARRYGTSNPAIFLENYQNGSTGIRIAIGRHDCTLGAYASTVERWVGNRIMTFIRENGMLVHVPDRAFTHKNIVERYQSKQHDITLEEIADAEGISRKILIESMSMVESQTGYVDLADEDETTSKHSQDYIDRSTDYDSDENTVNETVREYKAVLKHRDKALLCLLYGVDEFSESPTIPKHKIKREQARQLLTRHVIQSRARVAVASMSGKRR
jgi:hypothetical protein